MDKDRIYLEQIKEFCAKITTFVSGVSFERFVENEQLHLSVIKLIENIGEASKRISAEGRSRYPGADWEKAAKMRDRLTHHYMDVDLAIVYDVAINEVPRLLQELNK